MGTRSIIAAEFDEKHGGGIVATYCHYDGYIEGVGKSLIESYNDAESAFQLADMGYLTGLGETMDDTVEYSHANDEDPGYFTNPDHLADADWGEEYIYLWRDGQWWVVSEYLLGNRNVWVPLEKIVK